MADPVKEKSDKKPETVEQFPQIPEVPPPSASAAEVAGYDQYIKLKAAKTGMPTAILPGGRKIDATPFVKTRTNFRNVTKMLGDTDGHITTEKWRAEHPGWKYAWPVEKSEDTQAYLRSERYKAVPFDAIDKSNPDAMVMPSPTGSAIWKQHILVCMSPRVWYEEVTAAEHDSIRQTALTRASIENELTEAFGKQGFKGDVSITDVRQER